MYIRDLIASIARRWYLVVAGVVVTGLLCFFAFRLAPVSYEATGSVLLLPPKSSVGSRGNPFLYLGGLGQAAEVLTARLNATEVRTPLEDAHPASTFEIGPDVTTTGPILTVTVESSSATDSLQTVSDVLSAVPTTLSALQDDLSVPQGSQITVMSLAVDTKPEAVTKTRDRAVIALAGVGLAGTVLITGLLDGLLTARRQRRSEATAEEEDDAEGAIIPDDVSTRGRPTKKRAPRKTPVEAPAPDWS